MTQLELLAALRGLGAKSVDMKADRVTRVEFYPPDPPTPMFADKATAEVYEDMKRHSAAADEQLLYHSA
jgi:hypothetical protein